MAATYYTLVASLPYLPHFERAERSPMTPLRLEQRLSMLEPEDARQLAIARPLAGWRTSLATPKSDAEMAARCRTALQAIEQPGLRDFVEFRMDQQTILAGLRRRAAGVEPPLRSGTGQAVGTHTWGVGRRVRWIEAHWDDPEFRLTTLHPWIPQARGCLESGDARGLERLLMNVIWQRLEGMADANPFGFEAVFGFVFRWDILKAWLARDPLDAKKRFQAVVEEVNDGR